MVGTTKPWITALLAAGNSFWRLCDSCINCNVDWVWKEAKRCPVGLNEPSRAFVDRRVGFITFSLVRFFGDNGGVKLHAGFVRHDVGRIRVEGRNVVNFVRVATPVSNDGIRLTGFSFVGDIAGIVPPVVESHAVRVPIVVPITFLDGLQRMIWLPHRQHPSTR